MWQNWLPRKVMSAWRIAGILHALEGWTKHECGDAMMDAEKAWSAAIRHGFVPLNKAWEISKPGLCSWEMCAALYGTKLCWETMFQRLVVQILPAIKANYSLEEDKGGTIWNANVDSDRFTNIFVICMMPVSVCKVKKNIGLGFYAWV
jgi:hypothetical protein